MSDDNSRIANQIKEDVISSLTDNIGRPSVADTHDAVLESLRNMGIQDCELEVTDIDDPDCVNVNLTIMPNMDFIEMSTVVTDSKTVTGYTVDTNGNLVKLFNN